MTQFGWKAGAEQYPPNELLDYAIAAENAGFDTLEETITLGAEQPDDTAGGTLTEAGITVPAGFDDTTAYPFQVNITLPIDISFIE